MSSPQRVPFRTSILIAGCVLLGIVALALHPHLTGHPGKGAALRDIVALGLRDRLVHGTLLLLVGALLVGCTNYAVRRGFARPPVAAGLVGFAIGIGGLLAAGLIDGFLLPEFAARYVSSSPPELLAAATALTLLSMAVNTCTWFGLVAMAIAIGAWSVDLVNDRGPSRNAGIFGFVTAAATVAVLATGGSSIKPHALIAIFALQGAWFVWIAIAFERERTH